MSTSHPSDSLSPSAWRWLWGSALATLHLLLITLGLIAAGVFDPPRVGQRVGLPPVTLTLAAGEESLAWMPAALPETFHILIQGVLQSGAVDSGFGLVLGSPACHLGMGVSPTGYLTLWQTAGEATTPLRPWQAWPHVQIEGANEIWVNVEGDQMSWRVNGEQAWAATLPCPTNPRQVGYWAAAYGGPVTLRFSSP